MDTVGALLIQLKIYVVGLAYHLLIWYMIPRKYENLRMVSVLGMTVVWFTFGTWLRWYTQMPIMGMWGYV